MKSCYSNVRHHQIQQLSVLLSWDWCAYRSSRTKLGMQHIHSSAPANHSLSYQCKDRQVNAPNQSEQPNSTKQLCCPFPHHLGLHGSLATGSTWTLAQCIKFNLIPASVTIPGGEEKALVLKAMLFNNTGKQGLPDMIILALAKRSQIFYRAEAAWIYHNEQAWWCSFLGTSVCFQLTTSQALWRLCGFPKTNKKTLKMVSFMLKTYLSDPKAWLPI